MQIGNKLTLIFFWLIIAISTLITFYNFPNIPEKLTFDEVDFAQLALSLKSQPYTAYSQLATGHSTLYFYIILFFFELFGVNNFALRMPAAIFGLLNIPVFFFILKQTKLKDNNLIILLLTLTFATSRWYFNFSRYAFEATLLMFFELMSLLFVFMYINKKPHFKILLMLSGLFASFAFNSYTPGRIFFVVPLIIIILNSLINHKISIKNVKNHLINKKFVANLLYFIVPLIIAITPINAYFYSHQDDRFDNQFFLKNHSMTIQEKANGLWHNFSSLTLMFFYQGDVNARHNYPLKPALNPLIALLAFSGLIITAKNYKNIFNLSFLLFFAVSMLPAFLTYPWENPNMLRTITAIIPTIYFIGNSLNFIFKKISNKFVFLAFTMLILISSFYEVRTYFKYQVAEFNKGSGVGKGIQENLREIEKLGDRYE